MRRQITYVVLIVAASIGGIVYTLAAGNEPFLGLDLQGGASVVLEPAELEDGTEINEETLDQAVEIIRNRVDGLGVREPEVTRQGETILVQIPGVEDEARAIDLVGQTAELRFRPVLADGAFGIPFAETQLSSCSNAGELLTADPTPDAGAAECMIGTDKRDPGVTYLLGPAPLLSGETDGGSRLNGEALETASARFQLTEWTVNIVFRSGSPGIDDFNALAAQCSTGSAGCPPTGVDGNSGRAVGRLAIEIDGVVESAPNVGVSNFNRDQIVISGGNMQEDEAKDLALVLRFGALPLELIPQESRIVSSTLGEDALDSGITAGIIGLVLVSIYLVAYYRLLGVVAILSLAISGSLLWTMIAWLGETQGLALTLAGVTGLIVSIGVSVDSNVVYFEHLKEDVRNDRSLRSAVERAFPIAYSTIVKADVASLIAAVVLYFLTVGQVKGFALFLGLATVLDLVATYFFMGPAIRWLASRDGVEEKPSRFGIPTPAEVSS